jgi:hypothetical protein
MLLTKFKILNALSDVEMSQTMHKVLLLFSVVTACSSQGEIVESKNAHRL